MAETLPSPAEKTVVNNNPLRRLWTLTIASLALNALILVLLVAGAIIHHHERHHGFAGRYGYGGGCFAGQCQFGWKHHFHHFGGPGWGPQGGFGGDRFRGGNEGGPGGPGFFGGGPGEKKGPPDPAKMTDGILNHLSTTLSLTDDQKAKIKPVIEQQVAEIQKQMEAQRAAMQKQIEDGKAKIRPLLNADQQKLLDAMPLPGQKKSPAPDEPPPPAPAPGQ